MWPARRFLAADWARSEPDGRRVDQYARTFVATVEAAHYRFQTQATSIVVRLRLENITVALSDARWSISPSDIDALYVDGVSLVLATNVADIDVTVANE